MFFAVIKLPFQWGRQAKPKTALCVQSKRILKCYGRKAMGVHNRVTLPSRVRLSWRSQSAICKMSLSSGKGGWRVMVVGRDRKCTRQRKQHVLRPRGRNRGLSKVGIHWKEGSEQRTILCGPQGSSCHLSFIRRAVGAHGWRASNPAWKKETQSAH